ncbi:MAG: hypothetical protein ACI4RD_10070 [Kiritimatiellia bacterium]
MPGGARLAAVAAALWCGVAPAVTPEDMLSFPVAWNPEIPPGAVMTRPALTTSQKLLYLPRKKSGFAFTSNIEQTAYVSPDVVSTVHFKPINASKGPQLFVEVPESVEFCGGFRDFTMKRKGNVYHFVPGPRADKYTFYWRLRKPMPEGARFSVRYWGEWDGGAQRQEAKTLPVEVVRVPEAKGFRRLPAYFSMPSDFFATYPDLAGLKRCGFNLLDMWTYVEPGDDWGWPLIDATIAKCREIPGLDPIAWVREWWWTRGRESEEGAATLRNGQKTRAALCLSYRGEHFRRWIEQGKALLDRGLCFHTVDPEMYGETLLPGVENGEAICYCERCKAEFARYCQAHPSGDRFDFAARRYADFFREYREAMEGHLRAKGDGRRFRFMIYNAYHRSFAGFSGHRDYRQSHSYRGTLEDPVYFKGVFDILAPMVYVDVYANYNPYDMLLPWRDTYVLDRIVGGEIPVAPILCAGYPFQRAFDCDLNAEMLKWNILETVSAGGKGFGFWGECPFDAKDMQAMAEAINLLAPYEDIIATARPGGEIRCRSGNAVVKRIDSPRGSLAFVSEYSDRPLTVEIEARVGTACVRKSVRLGRDRIVPVLLR